MSPPKHNSVEPPWYGPVCPVVWEGRCREAPPIPIDGATRTFRNIRSLVAMGLLADLEEAVLNKLDL
jgi:hypothetical protein